MSGHRWAVLSLLGWVLLAAGRDGDWQARGSYPSELTCTRVMTVAVSDDVRREIGSVLADQPVDNPMRRQAWDHAERRVRQRYRCEWRGSTPPSS
jgi:hypothetical protein